MNSIGPLDIFSEHRREGQEVYKNLELYAMNSAQPVQTEPKRFFGSYGSFRFGKTETIDFYHPESNDRCHPSPNIYSTNMPILSPPSTPSNCLPTHTFYIPFPSSPSNQFHTLASNPIPSSSMSHPCLPPPSYSFSVTPNYSSTQPNTLSGSNPSSPLFLSYPLTQSSGYYQHVLPNHQYASHPSPPYSKSISSPSPVSSLSSPSLSPSSPESDTNPTDNTNLHNPNQLPINSYWDSKDSGIRSGGDTAHMPHLSQLSQHTSKEDDRIQDNTVIKQIQDQGAEFKVEHENIVIPPISMKNSETFSYADLKALTPWRDELLRKLLLAKNQEQQQQQEIEQPAKPSRIQRETRKNKYKQVFRTNDLFEVNEFRFGSGCPSSDPRFRKEHFVFGESEGLEYVGTILRGSSEFETIISSMEKVNSSGQSIRTVVESVLQSCLPNPLYMYSLTGKSLLKRIELRNGVETARFCMSSIGESKLSIPEDLVRGLTLFLEIWLVNPADIQAGNIQSFTRKLVSKSCSRNQERKDGCKRVRSQ